VSLLALNDHVLKGAGIVPTWVTGKLSDVTGLFFFPILLFTLAGLVRPVRHRVRRATAFAWATGVSFAAVKLVPFINAFVAAIWGAMVMDATDLLALPMLGLSVLYLRSEPHVVARGVSSMHARGRWVSLRDAAGVAFAGLASMATSSPMMVRAYPAWEVTGAASRAAGCVDVTPFVVKSGKEGIGLVATVQPRGGDPATAPCSTHLIGARIAAGGAAFPATVGKTAIDPSTRTVRTYLGFPFDNNTLWNAGLRDATLELDTDGSEGTRRIVFDLREVWPASHAPRTLVPAASSAQPSVSPSAPSTAPAHDGGVP